MRRRQRRDQEDDRPDELDAVPGYDGGGEDAERADDEERGRIPPCSDECPHALALGSRADEAVLDRFRCRQRGDWRHPGPRVLEDEG